MNKDIRNRHSRHIYLHIHIICMYDTVLYLQYVHTRIYIYPYMYNYIDIMCILNMLHIDVCVLCNNTCHIYICRFII